MPCGDRSRVPNNLLHKPWVYNLSHQTVALAKPYFNTVQSQVVVGLMQVPYSLVFLECAAWEGRPAVGPVIPGLSAVLIVARRPNSRVSALLVGIGWCRGTSSRVFPRNRESVPVVHLQR